MVRLRTDARGGGGRSGDDTQERIPQMHTEGVMGSEPETGQKQQQCVSVILLISTLGAWMEKKQMDGAKTQLCHGYLCIQGWSRATRNAGPVSATE